jgi:acyl-CoA synthetase (AMP-forming)/AMP-acid ligase II
VSQSPEVRWET